MDARYTNQANALIWASQAKLGRWNRVELAVVQARAELGLVTFAQSDEIHRRLAGHVFDLAEWQRIDALIKHDYNAFLQMCKALLPAELQHLFHQDMTSYDGEEPAFALALQESCKLVDEFYLTLQTTLVDLARRYRYSIMMGRTHGQWAELQTFGKRCLTWLKTLRVAVEMYERVKSSVLWVSKISGAVGNYGALPPELETQALAILGLTPYYGATQIVPRLLYAQLAQSLCQIVEAIGQIAADIRKDGQSGIKLCEEPFQPTQTGSSIMPQKRNNIGSEQLEGMMRMAQDFSSMLDRCTVTDRERSIEQSSVERVAWPDLFHVTLHSLKTIVRILTGLKVYPDNMLREVQASCGTYAAGAAQNQLKQMLAGFGVGDKVGYQIIQLAAFNLFEPTPQDVLVRQLPPSSMTVADDILQQSWAPHRQLSLQDYVPRAELRVSSDLQVGVEQVEQWNGLLRQVFAEPSNRDRWNNVFRPSNLLANESVLYREILGE